MVKPLLFTKSTKFDIEISFKNMFKNDNKQHHKNKNNKNKFGSKNPSKFRVKIAKNQSKNQFEKITKIWVEK